MVDTAAFTALDENTPRILRIASFRVSPNDLVRLSEEHKGAKFELVHMSSMEGFSAYNKTQRAAQPESENELYPKWQQAQYLYSMFLVHHPSLDNERYDGLSWSPVEGNIKKKIMTNENQNITNSNEELIKNWPGFEISTQPLMALNYIM